LNKLSRCTSMIASALLGFQPSDSLLRQRVMPGVEYRVWDPVLTESLITRATLSGEHEKALLKNLHVRRQLHTLSRLMEEHVFKLEESGEHFYKTGDFQGSSIKNGAGAVAALQYTGDYAARRFFNVVLSYNSTAHNKKAALLGLHNKSLSMEEFCSGVAELLGPEAEQLDLEKLFRLLDLDQSGMLTMEQFVTCIMSESQEHATYSRFGSLRRDSSFSAGATLEVVRNTVRNRLKSLKLVDSEGVQRIFGATSTTTPGAFAGKMATHLGTAENTDADSTGRSSPSEEGRGSPSEIPGCVLQSEAARRENERASTVRDEVSDVEDDYMLQLSTRRNGKQVRSQKSQYEIGETSALVLSNFASPGTLDGEDEDDGDEWV